MNRKAKNLNLKFVFIIKKKKKCGVIHKRKRIQLKIPVIFDFILSFFFLLLNKKVE